MVTAVTKKILKKWNFNKLLRISKLNYYYRDNKVNQNHIKQKMILIKVILNAN